MFSNRFKQGIFIAVPRSVKNATQISARLINHKFTVDQPISAGLIWPQKPISRSKTGFEISHSN
ncbi:MAG: hypothetical protein KKE86_17240 [Planctomycetes bacterium]|nr:hypothetical protein [Planctomycetota bacterium]MBU4401060.1 hypothetical protein [Planctomycetota bacterium]